MTFLIVLSVLTPIFVQVQAEGKRNSTEMKQKFVMCEQFKEERMDLDESIEWVVNCGTFAASDYTDVEEYIIQESPHLMDRIK